MLRSRCFRLRASPPEKKKGRASLECAALGEIATSAPISPESRTIPRTKRWKEIVSDITGVLAKPGAYRAFSP